MKKIAFILSCIMIMALIPALGVSAAEYPLTPISTSAEFEAMSKVPGNYYLTGDIDFGGKVYDRCILENFDGILDGDGHKLYNFSINYTEASADAGLILRVGQNEDTTIKNLTIGSADIPIVYSFINNNKSVSPFAAVIGNNDPGTNVVFENIHIYADVDVIYADAGHKGNAAGFVAYCCKKGSGTFTNCSFNGTFDAGIENEGTVYRNAGGFISANNLPELTMTNCVNNANVTQGNTFVEARAAGFIAYTAAGKNVTFTNCVNNGKITVLGDTAEAQVAGFFSDMGGTAIITGCTNKGEIAGKYFTGGFIAYVKGTGCILTDCVNNGAIDMSGMAVSASCGFVLPGCEPTMTNFTNTSSAPDAVTTEPETTAAPETDAPATTEEATTEAPVTDAPTEAPVATDAPATDAPAQTDAPDSSGCGGMISGIVAIVAILGTALVIKKRD